MIKDLNPDLRIDRITSIRSVNRFSEVISQPECMDRFSQSVKVVILGQSADEFNELIFEHQFRPACREKGITSRDSIDGKREDRIVTPYKGQIA